jgi:glyoxylase-like metal-dependent hydrolase (beta-lactamase superfamily II)/8-oxo-dGTP pyrophosphatase MutT (NUDIX family)
MSEPKDAAAIILIKNDKVLLAQRNPQLSFLGGWHAFPGGKLDETDLKIKVKNCEDVELERFIVCAVREVFEEVGVLLVRNGEKLTKGQRASLHDDLVSGRSTFGEILDDWGLWIDAEDFNYTGFWTTPKFSPVRFKTRFFIAECPAKQMPYAAISELQNIEFITPDDALKLWERGDILISPPVLLSLQELAESEVENGESKAKRLLKKSNEFDGVIDYLEINSRHIVMPLKTQTLPPATHTNCFIVGRREFIVIDAASTEIEEQEKLRKLVDELLRSGGVCQEIIVSHLHNDHHGGEIALKNHLKSKGFDVPLATHKLTAEKLPHIKFDKFIEDGDIYELKDETGKAFQLKTLHTPGHARGLLNFYDEEVCFLLSTDNVVGTGTVVIAPPEGDMKDYLDTLQRLKNLRNLKHLCGSHGSAVFDAKTKIEEYISHRLKREKEIVGLIEQGFTTPEELVERIYVGLKPELIRLAIKSVEAHLAKIEQDQIS